MTRTREPRIICRCDWCKEDIYAGQKFYRGDNIGIVHQSCLKPVAIDQIRFELSEDQIAEMLGMDTLIAVEA